MTLNRTELEALIVQRAWTDEAFRGEFLGDPKATIEKYAEQKLPAELKVIAHAEDDTTVHFVILQKPANADELSDEDLEKVAGGIDIIAGVTLAVGLGVAAMAGLGAAGQVTRYDHGW